MSKLFPYADVAIASMVAALSVPFLPLTAPSDLHVANHLSLVAEPETAKAVSQLSPEWRVARAALRMITEGESRCAGLSAYAVMYGCRPFTDMSSHPDQCFPINLPGYEGLCSTAAGRYQFITTTWEMSVSYCADQGIVIDDFSPSSQDMGAVCLMAKTDALQSLLQGIQSNPEDGSVTVTRDAFETFLVSASVEWASLAYSDANQPTLSAETLWVHFNQHLHHENFPAAPSP